jgi:hypothetical protein
MTSARDVEDDYVGGEDKESSTAKFSAETSSSYFYTLVFGGIGEYIDLLFSYLRWTRLGIDYQNGHEIPHPETDNGSVLDAVRHEPLLAGLVVLVVLITARQGWRYAADQARLQEIRDKLACERMEDEIQEKLKTLDKNQPQEKLDAQLKKQKLNPKFVRFKNATIHPERKEPEKILEYKPAFNPRSLIDAPWQAINIASFTYWLSWFFICVATGTFGPSVLGLILAYAMGSIYLGLRTTHFFRKSDTPIPVKNKKEEYELILACVDEIEKERVEESEDEEEESAKSYSEHAINAYRIFGEFVFWGVTAYLISQFLLWLASDTLLIVAGITLAPALCSALGTLGFVYAISVGLYKAYGKYQAIQQGVSGSFAEGNPGRTDEEKEVKRLEGEIRDQLSYADRLYKDCKDSNIVFLIYAAMTPVFIARVYTLSITSPFIPAFFHMPAVFATLTCPQVYLIIIGAAVAWALFRLSLKLLEERAQRQQTIAKPLNERNKLAGEEAKALTQYLKEKTDEKLTVEKYSFWKAGVTFFRNCCGRDDGLVKQLLPGDPGYVAPRK